MIITIREQGASVAAEALSSLKVKSQVTRAIREALKAGKTEGRKLTKARYVTPDINRLGKISSRASGMNGRLTISGRRNLIKLFKLSPNTRPPTRPLGGLRVQIVKGGGGQLPHAFVNRRGIVFENVGGRKLRHLSTVSLPGAWEVVGSKVEAALIEHLEKNLEAIV